MSRGLSLILSLDITISMQQTSAPAEAGWTDFAVTAPSGEGAGFTDTGTRIVYVSQSTGNDGNTGTLASPKKTLAAGLAAVRDGKPDHLLCKRGDTWTDEQFGFITVSGKSTSEPMVFGDYGSGALPLIKVNNNAGLPAIGVLNNKGNHIAIQNLDFYCYTRNPADAGYNAGTVDEAIGLGWNITGATVVNDLFIEGCAFRFFSINISIQGNGANPVDGVTIRRTRILDAWLPDTSGHSQGLYTFNAGTLLVDESILDHNGYNETGTLNGGANIFNHNVYHQRDAEGVATFRKNISCRASATGISNAGGTTTDNLMIRNPIAMLSGGHTTVNRAMTVTNNVILLGSDIDVGTPRGLGVVADPTLAGAATTVTSNIIAHISSASGDNAIQLATGTTNVTCQNNIVFDWAFGIADLGSGNTVSLNDVDLSGSNNNPGGAAPHEPFTAPTRTIGGYMASIGLTATEAAFYAAVRQQYRGNWRADLETNTINDWFRAGFDVAPV